MHKGKKEIRIWRDGGSRLRKEKPDITPIKEAYFLAFVFSEKDNY